MMARHLEKSLQDLNWDTSLMAVEEADISDIESSDLLLLGSPAMGVEEIEEYEFRPFFEDIQDSLDGLNVILFGSYDWGEGEWLENWKEECEALGANVLTTFSVVLEPQDEDLEKIDTTLLDVL